MATIEEQLAEAQKAVDDRNAVLAKEREKDFNYSKKNNFRIEVDKNNEIVVTDLENGAFLKFPEQASATEALKQFE